MQHCIKGLPPLPKDWKEATFSVKLSSSCALDPGSLAQCDKRVGIFSRKPFVVFALNGIQMATKLNFESFLSALKKSGLIDREQLQRFWQGYTDRGGDPDNLPAIADALVKENRVTRWQADKLLLGKYRGFFLGKYRLLSHLGTGGMSSVYLAEHVVMRRLVALKVLPQTRVDEPTSHLERFHREAQAIASLDHVNIVRAYDIDTEGNIHFLVMEYVEGYSLQELVHNHGPMGFIDAADNIRQAADGLAHAHVAGMVHRDIKPGNLLVDAKGVVKLLDMGLAMFFDDQDDDPLTIRNDEKVLGTADYLSPEQALDSHTVDVRADIYSLGCTLYFLLTGHPPFPEGTLTQRLLAHQTKVPTPIEQDRPDAPASLVAIATKMMQKKPENRYQTAKEAAAALVAWLVENGDAKWRSQNSYLARTVTGSAPLSPPAPPSDSATKMREAIAASKNVPQRSPATSPAFSDTESVPVPTRVPLLRTPTLPPVKRRPRSKDGSGVALLGNVLSAVEPLALNLKETPRHKLLVKFLIVGVVGALVAWFVISAISSGKNRGTSSDRAAARQQRF